MTLPDLPFTVIDWAAAPAIEHPGERGSAFWLTFTVGNMGRPIPVRE